VFHAKSIPNVKEIIGYPLPQSGPVIVNECTGHPYVPDHFRLEWRATANAAGLPKTVKNMHSGHRACTVPELRRENRKFRAALLVARDALNGSDTVRSQALKLVCEALDSASGDPPKPPSSSRQVRERYSLWRDPRARRGAQHIQQ
jgi:hypothetical protein